MTQLKCTDPMERIIESALVDAGIAFQSDFGDGTSHNLDFDLIELGIAIEVKRLHSPRIAAQMSRTENVIAAQGIEAVRLLAKLIRGMK